MDTLKRNIIVIDDDREIWNAYGSVLGSSEESMDSASLKLAELLNPGNQVGQPLDNEFQLSFAAQGQEGFNMVQGGLADHNPFSVAFIDIRMPPGWDGMETATRIRQLDPRIEIVIVTAYTDRSREEIVRTVGAADKLLFLRKPFDPEELYQLALSLSEKWNLARREEMVLAELESSEARFRSLVETTSDFVWETDAIGRFLYCSPVCEDIYGFRPEEMIGRPFYEILLCGDEAVRHQRFFERCVNNITSFRSVVRQCQKKDGHDLDIETSGVPVLSENGDVIGFRGIDRDVSERVLAQKEKRRLEEQYQHAQKMEAIGTLAGGIAHDLNNVLTPILGYTEMCRMRSGPEGEFEEELEIIEQSATKAARLIRQILTFSRKQVLTPTVCDLNRLITDFMKMLRRLIREDIELLVDLAEDLWAVHIDVSQMEQILINLVVNARDAIGENGRVQIYTSNQTIELDKELVDVDLIPFHGDYVLLRVSDNGSGMDLSTMERIFDPFFTTKEVGRGTGLGLATVYGVANQHKGHIRLKSVPGQGTTFYIYLPKTEEEVRKQILSDDTNHIAGGKESVMVVEDDEAVRSLAVAVLKRFGYTVSSAVNGLEAMETYQQAGGNIDLLVSDVVMPGRGGRDLVAALREIRPELPVIFISGDPRELTSSEIADSPRTAFIQKPFKPQTLALKVREMLDSGE